MIGSFQVAGSQSAKGDLLTDKVNCCLALLVLTIYVDNSFISSADGGLRRRVSPCCPILPVLVPHPGISFPKQVSGAERCRSSFSTASVAFTFFPLLLFQHVLCISIGV